MGFGNCEIVNRGKKRYLFAECLSTYRGRYLSEKMNIPIQVAWRFGRNKRVLESRYKNKIIDFFDKEIIRLRKKCGEIKNESI